MSLTLLQAANKLAPMLGAAHIEELEPGDQVLLRDLINEVVGKIFVPINGHYPKWTERRCSLRFPAPRTIPIVASTPIEGQPMRTVSTSQDLTGVQRGSKLMIGGVFYTVAAVQNMSPGFQITLVQEWNLPAGSYEGTLYQHCRLLPVDMVATIGQPQAQDIGPLTALDGEDDEIKLRSFVYGDFYPVHSRYSAIGYPRRTFERAHLFDIGDPYFFWVDSSQYGETGQDMRSTFVLYPVPDRECTVDLRYNFLPQLSADSDIIPLPAQMESTVFIPLCREAVAVNFPDYSGRNVELLMREAEKARMQIENASRPQRQHHSRIRPARGWY